MKSIPLEELSDLLGLTPRRIQQLADQGFIPKPDRRGLYDAKAAVAGVVRFWKSRGGEGGKDYQREKTRKMKADADLAEIELAKQRGQFLSVTDFSLMIGGILRTVRDRVWSSLLPEDDRREILNDLSKAMLFADVIPKAEEMLGFKFSVKLSGLLSDTAHKSEK